MKMKRLSSLVIVICCVALLGGLLYRVFGRAIRYEIPGGFKGWLLVRWDDQRCLPLRRQGMFLLLSFPRSDVACTSTPRFANLTYLRFEYVFPDGTRQSLRWNEHGKPGTQVWLLGYSEQDKSDEIFVGDEHEDWNRYPKPATERR
jgi:hypothetical protein